MTLVNLPNPTPAEEDEAIIQAMKQLNSFGVTGAVNMGQEWQEYVVHRRLRDTEKLTIRLASTTPLALWDKLYSEIQNLTASNKDPQNDDWLYLGMLKGFADGALGTHTAALIDDYSDEPGNKGLLVTGPADLLQWTRDADSKKLQVAIHAIGDRANRIVLDIFGNVTQFNGKRDRRFRIEHAQQIQESDMQRFKDISVIASYQPIHMIDDLVYAPRLIGNRIHDLYRMATMANLTKTIYGSDWAVASPDVRLGMFAALARQSTNYPEGFDMSESVSIETVLKSYTANAAYAMFRENKLGMIKEEYLADVTIWGSNLIKLANDQNWDEFKKVLVVKTIVGGKVMYSNT
jgi:predicted amidohydrolase YtcJ